MDLGEYLEFKEFMGTLITKVITTIQRNEICFPFVLIVFQTFRLF